MTNLHLKKQDLLAKRDERNAKIQQRGFDYFTARKLKRDQQIQEFNYWQNLNEERFEQDNQLYLDQTGTG
jgi:hypothetical protein